MHRIVLGTAGHIDHGKTALVRALTGTDTDRLPDEKRRGITIDIGFASLTLADGTMLSIVDVPGHEAFVRNMLAGATGIDIVLLVVAADEGVMPQTREHLAILELLGLERGVVALTKSDLVEDEWLDLVKDELRELLASTSLADAPVIGVSARTGAGLDELRAAVADAAAQVPIRSDDDLFRMPVDRVFTIRGTGTVVTGTVWSGAVRADDHLYVLPAGFTARIRGLQQHGTDCTEVRAGARAAIALGGVARDALGRGDCLLGGDGWSATSLLTVHLTVLPDAAAPVRPRQRVRVHVGTAEVLGRIARLRGELAAGQSAIVQIRLEAPLVARAGDHLVIRASSPVRTIGGGVVLEPAPTGRKRMSAPVNHALETMARSVGAVASRPDAIAYLAMAADRLDAAVVLAGGSGLDRRLLPVVTGLSPATAGEALRTSGRLVLTGDMIVPRDDLDRTGTAILGEVRAFHQASPLHDGIDRESARRALHDPPLFDAAVTSLIANGSIVTSGNALAVPGHAAAPDADAAAALARVAAIYRQARLEPPDLADLPSDLAARPDLPLLIRLLERDGTLVRVSATRLIDAGAVSEAVLNLRSQLLAGQQLGIGDFREVLQLTRKHLIPLLEHFDRTGVTRRSGETRVLASQA